MWYIFEWHCKGHLSSSAFHTSKCSLFLWYTVRPIWPQHFHPHSSHIYSYTQHFPYNLPFPSPKSHSLFTVINSIWINPLEKSFHCSTNLFNNFDFQYCLLHSLSYSFCQLRTQGSLHKHNTTESFSFDVPLLVVILASSLFQHILFNVSVITCCRKIFWVPRVLQWYDQWLATSSQGISLKQLWLIHTISFNTTFYSCLLAIYNSSLTCDNTIDLKNNYIPR